ncbi:polysaccharide biosynthesis protein [Candidatus Planktophila dulcis]|uniref:polysaccharide biosynthesis protein n=1 Tax=Candidatus Planktophila dulcis TaxID=1884914 RepID=UPI003CF0B6AA
MKADFDGATITITGGTGSFGSTMVKELLASKAEQIRIFSRDENKQDLMRNSLKDDRLRFYIGDVRDRESVRKALRGSEYIFHAAALKQVPSCEFFPKEAVSTNIYGSANVIEESIAAGAKSVVCLSTDKAVYPINAMGISKSMMEKVAQATARENLTSETKIAITRYGNVMFSRGSVIPLFVDQILSGKPVTVTNPVMTRFMMSLQDSVDLVKHAFQNANTGDLFVRKAPACTIQTLVEALYKVLDRESETQITCIGTRHGEKVFESLLSQEERGFAQESKEYFKVPLDTRSLDYEVYFEKGEVRQAASESFNSHNTHQMKVDEVVALLKNNSEFKKLRDSHK